MYEQLGQCRANPIVLGPSCLLNGAEAASVLKNALPETPIILFTMYTDLHADSLSAFIGVDFISKVPGIPKLLERVDALLPE